MPGFGGDKPPESSLQDPQNLDAAQEGVLDGGEGGFIRRSVETRPYVRLSSKNPLVQNAEVPLRQTPMRFPGDENPDEIQKKLRAHPQRKMKFSFLLPICYLGDFGSGMKNRESLVFPGAEEVNRTPDLPITNRLLYQLSYFGKHLEGLSKSP